MKKAIKILFIIGVSLFILLSGYTIYTYISIKDTVDKYTKTEPNIVYDMKDVKVDEISIQKGESVDINEIPIDLRNAFIAVEDKRFYRHHGIDLRRIAGAMIANISKGRIAQGGSTISQQLAKNAFLTNERTFSRKFKEVVITFEIERLYSKDKILEKYLNEIYFGSGSYGVKEAAMDIFGKDVSNLNLAEAAMIAGIPNRPATYNPRINLKASIERSHLILKLMLNQKLITEYQYEQALDHKFLLEQDKNRFFSSHKNTSIIVKDGQRKRIGGKAPDFVDIVEDKITNYIDPKVASKGGLYIYTTLDSNMQKVATSEFNRYNYFKKNKELQGAMVTLDANTGEIRSVVGGKNYLSGNFNRAFYSKKQIGSTFKPYIYLTALQNNYTMNQLIDSKNKSYGNWNPRNYGNAKYNNVTMMESIEKSINTSAIELMNELGVENVAKNFYLSGTSMDLDNNLASALGTSSGSPIDLATVYLPFASGGQVHEPTLIRRIEDKDGNVLYDRGEIKENYVFDTLDISLTTYLLKDVVENGSGRNAKVGNIDQGGKTGTTNDFRAAWYAGFTRDLVTVVYVGYDNNKSMPKGYSGGRIAAPLWKNFYTHLISTNNYNPSRFDFIKNNIKSKELVYRNIDVKTGSFNNINRDNKRKALFKKGQVPEGKVTRFFKGITNSTKGFFKRLFD